jgi:hypothetical protein
MTQNGFKYRKDWLYGNKEVYLEGATYKSQRKVRINGFLVARLAQPHPKRGALVMDLQNGRH